MVGGGGPENSQIELSYRFVQPLEMMADGDGASLISDMMVRV